MIKGWSYFGVRNPRHVAVDLDDMIAHGANSVLFTCSEEDMAFYANTMEKMVQLAKERNMGVITMKPLSGGLLCLPEHEREGLDRDPIVTGSLRYILANENVSLAIPGMQKMQEVEENVPVGDMPEMTEEVAAELLRSVGAMKREYRYGQVCLRCGYCQPCPQEVPTPTVFRALDMYRSYPESLKHLGLELYESLEVKADACVECKQCLEKCPAGINIPMMLKEAVQIFANARG